MRSRILGLCLVLVGVSLIMTFPDSRASAGTDFDCSTDIQLIGVPGSGENPNRDGQFGGTVWSAITELTANQRKAGRTVASKPVNYPAEAVDVIATNPGRYFDGLSEGVGLTLSMLTDFALNKECAQQRLVLVGYSQGAIVLHRVAHTLQEPGFKDVASRIDGIVLIADGDKVPNDAVSNFGTAPRNRHGVGQDYSWASGSTWKKFDRMWGNRIKDVCNKDDVVCGLYMIAPPIAAIKGVDIHKKYAGSDAVKSGANAVKFNFPSDTVVFDRAPAPVTGKAGVPISLKLSAKSGRNCMVTFALKVGSKLPEGLSLSSSGQIDGAPVKDGKWSTAITAAADCGVRGKKSATQAVKFEIQKASVEPPVGAAEVLPFAGLVNPNDIAVDRANAVYVADIGGRAISKLESGAKSAEIVPIPGVQPGSVDLDQEGNLYCIESGSGEIYKLPFGSAGPVRLPFNHRGTSFGLSVTGNGDVYVLYTGQDRNAPAVYVLRAGAAVAEQVALSGLEAWYSPMGPWGQFPADIAVSVTGDIFVSFTDGKILKYRAGSSEPSQLPVLKRYDDGAAVGVYGLAVSKAGDVLASLDSEVWIIRDGVGTKLPFSGDLDNVRRVAFDADGNVYAAEEHGRKRVLKLPASSFK